MFFGIITTHENFTIYIFFVWTPPLFMTLRKIEGYLKDQKYISSETVKNAV